MVQVAQLNVPVAGRECQGVRDVGKRPGTQTGAQAEHGPEHGNARRFHPGPTGPVSARDYLIQASTLSLLASTHFLAAASSDSLSWAMYLATVFWSSFVQLKFFTRL